MACQKEDQELDRISHLPDLLTDKILSLVPIRDAVRTSVLSSKWRFKWTTTLSKLVFDDNCTAFRGNGKSICSLLVNIVDSVLLLHSGGIKTFELSHRQYRATADIDRWILHLCKVSINSFRLCIHKGTPYKVPSCLFSCQSLSSLDLYNCSLNIPPTFSGFKNLKALILDCVRLSKQVLEDIISGSCQLVKLTMFYYHFQNLVIDAPKLEYLSFTGVVEGIILTNSFSAPSFHMDFNEDKDLFPDAPTGYINLLRFFDPIRNVEALTLDGHVLKYLSIQEVPALLVLPVPFLRLHTLVISGVHFKNVKEILVILCLLQSAPNLEEVNFLAPKKGDKTIEHTVGMDDCSGDEIYDSASNITFAHLKYACLIGIHHDSALEMGFAGLLLLSSPALQKMTIKVADLSTLYPKGSGEYKLLKHMMRLKCASTRVELVLMDASDT